MIDKKEILEYFGGDTLATDVFINKYSNDAKQAPTEVQKRLAKEFARIEEGYIQQKTIDKYDSLSLYGRTRYNILLNKWLNDGSNGLEDYFLNYLRGFKNIIPGGSVLEALGVEGKEYHSISNCLVTLPPEDSINDINRSVNDGDNIFKRKPNLRHYIIIYNENSVNCWKPLKA